MPNGIDLILADHRRVEALFAAFETSLDGSIIGQVIDALDAHDSAEHAALYPLAGHLLDDAVALERWAAAHSAVKKQIDIIKALEGVPLTEAFRLLQRLVTEHVSDEEKNLLPALGREASEQQLEGLGARLMQVKQRVG